MSKKINKLLKYENKLKEHIINKFGDQFDVSKIKFKRSTKHVVLICKDHGEFSMTPDSIRISKYLCRKCINILQSKNNTRTTEQFKVEAWRVHGDTYIYDCSDYKHSETLIDIECRIHGIFQQTPHSHLKGHGCAKCGRDIAAEKTKLTPEVYFEKANLKHNYKFNYDNSEYNGSENPITYICPVHGEVTQIAGSHLVYGCEQCGHEVNVVPFEEFVARARIIHGYRFEYIEDTYKDIGSKLSIICPKHGVFEQIAEEHLRAKGCPICSSSKNEQRIYMLLLELGLTTIREFKFKDSKLRYDFYLPDLNILIEYDGPQHFLVVPLWGGAEGLANRRKNDLIKNKMAEEASILLKRLNYKLRGDIEIHVINFISEYFPYKHENKFFKTFEELKEHLSTSEVVVSDDIDIYKTELHKARYSSDAIMKSF